MIKHCCFFLLLLSTFAANANEPDTGIQWQAWSDAAFQQAREENKLVLLDIKAQWCQYCKKMASVTYQNPQVIKIVKENYIAIRGDIENTAPIARRYGYFGVPATVVLTAEDKELNRRLGYISPQFMQWHLLGILQEHQEQQGNNSMNAVKSNSSSDHGDLVSQK